MTTLQRAPVLFISHGAPTFALEPGVLGARLQEIGASLGALRAVVVVSPHWQTRDLRVAITALPQTIHDFGGFDPKLYTLAYPAPGAPEVAQDTIRLLADAGLPAAGDAQWGLDHGTWVPMMHMLPDAHVPVFQVSVPYDLSTQGALELGRALAPLRDQGVVIAAFRHPATVQLVRVSRANQQRCALRVRVHRLDSRGRAKARYRCACRLPQEGAARRACPPDRGALPAPAHRGRRDRRWRSGNRARRANNLRHH